MTHWVRNLPEVGDQALKLASQIEAAARRAVEAKLAYKSAQRALQEVEAEAFCFAATHWSAEEIQRARGLIP